jgi:hypothetical protein
LGEGRPILMRVIGKGNISLKIFKIMILQGERNEPLIRVYKMIMHK